MRARSIWGRIVVVLISSMMLVMSAGLAWGVVADYQSRGIIPQGVTVAGMSLAGMTEGQARQIIEQSVSEPMERPITATADGKSWTLDPSGIVAVDVDAMLDDAYSSRRTTPIAGRLDSQLRGTSLSHEVEPVYSVDTNAVADWVVSTASQLDHKPVNAKSSVDDKKYTFKITPGIDGVSLDQTSAAQLITEALSPEKALASSGQIVVLPVRTTKPKVEASDFKRTIVVSISQRKVYFYKRDKLVKTYRCAPGRPAFPTPTGDFEINRKAAYAPWINPGSDWAKDMPRIIPGGPSNPMGVHKIGINMPGIYLHGIPASEYSSIGTAASHGCMRMMPSDVADLYKRVKVGDPVYIRP